MKPAWLIDSAGRVLGVATDLGEIHANLGPEQAFVYVRPPPRPPAPPLGKHPIQFNGMRSFGDATPARAAPPPPPASPPAPPPPRQTSLF